MAPSAIESLDEPDLLARQFTRIVGAVTVLLGSGALILLFSRQWIPALVMAVLAVPTGMLTKRLSLNIPATVRLDGGGIHRKGTYGWSVPWDELEYAGIHPYDGAHVLVAVPQRHVSHWSRNLRMKDQVLTEDLGPLPEGGYVAPVFDDLAWDMEHYIAGHLPGHPGFDPARLHLPPHLMRSQYDDGEAASPGTPTTRRATPRPDPVAVRAADPLPRRQARMFGLLALLALAFAVVSWFMLRDPVQGFTRSQIAAIVALGIA
ncbi:MAG TPA: hypothetical protein GX743_06115, partial [Actinomycetales bacterium]|nr:hypothetical protein [Actinomycetales bacterium]